MTDILLDTHVWLWLQTDPQRIGTTHLERFARADRLLLSVASTWEIAIKYRLGKLPLPTEPRRYLPSRIRSSGTEVLAIEMEHTLRAGALDLHHRDPFDRLLIAQAQTLRAPLATADPAFEDYGIRLIQV